MSSAQAALLMFESRLTRCRHEHGMYLQHLYADKRQMYGEICMKRQCNSVAFADYMVRACMRTQYKRSPSATHSQVLVLSFKSLIAVYHES